MSEENINIEPDNAPEAEAPQAPTPVVEAEPKVSSEWEKMLDELPEAWHQKVTPYILENERNSRAKLDEYEPFREFVDSKLDPAVIRDSLRLAEIALNDPAYLHRMLSEQLRAEGKLEEAAAVDAQADAIEEGEADEYELSPALRKEFEARDMQLQQQQEYIQNIEYEKEVAAEQAALEESIAEINSRYDIPDHVMERILSVYELQLQKDENATLYTAARELAQITGIRYVERGANPTEPAPMIMGNGGGAGVPADLAKIPADDAGKRKLLEDLFKSQLSAN